MDIDNILDANSSIGLELGYSKDTLQDMVHTYKLFSKISFPITTDWKCIEFDEDAFGMRNKRMCMYKLADGYCVHVSSKSHPNMSYGIAFTKTRCYPYSINNTT